MLIHLHNGGKVPPMGVFFVFFIRKFLLGNKISAVSSSVESPNIFPPHFTSQNVKVAKKKPKLLTTALSSPSLGLSACNLWLIYASSRLTCLCPDGGLQLILTFVFLLSVSDAGFFFRCMQRPGDVFIAAR